MDRIRGAECRKLGAGAKIFVILAACFLFANCAKPLVEGKLMSMEPVTKKISTDANTIYYAVKWAMEQAGYPLGAEDLQGGVIESKWVPTGAGSHYVDVFDGKDYGANAAYYKMIIKIKPVYEGGCDVVAQTVVKSIANGMISTGDKEREILAKISEHVRGYDISVTNLGVEE